MTKKELEKARNEALKELRKLRNDLSKYKNKGTLTQAESEKITEIEKRQTFLRENLQGLAEQVITETPPDKEDLREEKTHLETRLFHLEESFGNMPNQVTAKRIKDIEKRLKTIDSLLRS